MMPVGKPVSGARNARGMALAVAASLLIHLLIAARLLSAPGVALQTPFDTDAQVDVLLDTPAPSAAGTTSPDDNPQAEPVPAPVAETPPPPQPQTVPPAPPAEAVPPAPPPPAEPVTPAVPAAAIPPTPPPEAVPPVKPRPAAPPVTPPKPQVHRPMARLPSHRSPAPTSEPGAPASEADVASDVAAMAAALTPARPLQGYAGNRDPIYPEAARRRGEQGRVILRVDVSSGGEPVSVIVQQSSGFPRLDAAAATAVRQWRFEPAARGGKSMAGIAEVPILFRLEN